MSGWNLWHGCHKISPGCAHCYVYRMDEAYGRDASQVRRNADFSLPLRKNRQGVYKIPPGDTVYTCFTSDFFLEDADPWRAEAWDIIRQRPDVHFLIVTKRIHRFFCELPQDWENGWPHVTICCTVEDQQRAEERLPIFLQAPIRHKEIICEPLLGPLHLEPWLGPWCEGVQVGGESGPGARTCRYEWVLDIRCQCMEASVPFVFRQTGARLEKDGKLYRIPRKFQHSQAKKAGIDWSPNGKIHRGEWE